uniref:Uncharacterized protein n=1 Tax=Oryza nivara TaxID=4536 RepID=A0A0E0H9N6_ORYNI
MPPLRRRALAGITAGAGGHRLLTPVSSMLPPPHPSPRGGVRLVMVAAAAASNPNLSRMGIFSHNSGFLKARNDLLNIVKLSI